MTRRECAALLRESGIVEADTEARLLFSHFSGRSAAALYAAPELSLDSEPFREALRRRTAHEPLAYILGCVEFCSETYRVTPDCLIPRADTELLVEAAATLLPPHAHFADLCTGSGCVSISTLCRRPDTTAEGYELSPAALRLSVENAERNGVSPRVCYHAADLLTDPLPPARFDAILSNPPYIPSRDIESLSPEVKREPSLALDGGSDGMRFYRRFLQDYAAALKPDGFFLFEIGYDQADGICALAAEHGYHAEIRRDYGSNPRVAYLRKKL